MNTPKPPQEPTPVPEGTRDVDLLNADAALRRAGRKALELALQTGTPCYVWQDGKVVNIGAPVPVPLPTDNAG